MEKENKFCLLELELEILKLIVKGYDKAEIAEKLKIEDKDTEKIIFSIFNKLGVNSFIKASIKAVKNYLV